MVCCKNCNKEISALEIYSGYCEECWEVINMICCKNCNKEISTLENNIYSGYCENCYEILREKKTKCDNYTHANNVVATILQSISIIIVLIVFAAGFIFICASSFEMTSIIISIIIMIGTCIGSVFIYGFGEIIQLLDDIKNK